MKLSSGLMWGGGGLLLGAGLLALLQAIGVHIRGLPAGGRPASPIKIVGGTLKFRTDPKKLHWVAAAACVPPVAAVANAACIVTDTQEPTTGLSWSGTSADNGLSSLVAWDVVINFGGSTTNYVRIYPSTQNGVCTAQSGSCAASASGWVSAYAAPVSSTKLFIWPDSPDDMQASAAADASAPHRKFRYVDPESTNAVDLGKTPNPYYVNDVTGFVVHSVSSSGAFDTTTLFCNVAGSAGECEIDVP
jgi:hypothetical protein